MLQRIQELIVYRIPNDHMIARLFRIIQENDISSSMQWIKELLDMATRFGWYGDLWQFLLTHTLLTSENSYTLSQERQAYESVGSIHTFLIHDMEIFKDLFQYDFHPIDETLPIPCFSIIKDYKALSKRKELYDGWMGDQIMEIGKRLFAKSDSQDMLHVLHEYYQIYGIGDFAFHKAFRIQNGETCVLQTIVNLEEVTLDDLIGYEDQKKSLYENTFSFVSGKKANNVLLYGESGTGKSTSIKAIANMFFDKGLRIIEIHKHQFHLLHEVIQQIKSRNYYFIIYMDDLSFEEDETEYKYLKAVIEGGMETRPSNVLIYATSNRRHLIKETWRDRSDIIEEQDLHVSETMSEKLSLVARFGISIYYGKPSAQDYHNMVKELAAREHITAFDADELWQYANAWELRHGGVSGRCARQLIDYLSFLSSSKE